MSFDCFFSISGTSLGFDFVIVSCFVLFTCLMTSVAMAEVSEVKVTLSCASLLSGHHRTVVSAACALVRLVLCGWCCMLWSMSLHIYNHAEMFLT